MSRTEIVKDRDGASKREAQLEETIATVIAILEGMEIADVSPESVIVAPPYYDGEVLLKRTAQFSLFVGPLAVRLRFIGYPYDDVLFLTVRELCEMYLSDS